MGFDRPGYPTGALDEKDLPDEPLPLFRAWVEQAMEVEGPEPTAMTLATVGEDGSPAARIVLMRRFDEQGIVWFTNYGSRKGRELEHEPRAALVFYWGHLVRAVRVEGTTEKILEEESDDYFASRPPDHRIGAWASDQWSVLPSREKLERSFVEVRERFGDEAPRPPYWGGYRLTPGYYEFWQGRPSRLHDRIGYRHTAGATWERFRLAP